MSRTTPGSAIPQVRYQHFRQAQLRAAETGLPLLRAANTGISGAIDARGRVIDALAINARGYFDVELTVPPHPADHIYPPSTVGLAIVGIFGLFSLLVAMRTPISFELTVSG